MEDQRLAVHRTIVVVDVEGFGDHHRTNADQVVVRAGLYRAMRETFGSAGVSWDDCRHEDRGDGLFVLVPAEVPKGLLIEQLPPVLAAKLRGHNDVHPGTQRIRMRMALHAGEVRYDGYGVTGASVNLAFRLLDASPLKTALAGSPGVLAVIASSWFFEEVVRHSAVASAYCQVKVSVKETTTTGWICLPDQAGPAALAMLERLLAASALPPPPSAVLRTLPRDTAAFIGRTDELDRLMAAIERTEAPDGVIGIYAVDGMAGIGKTAFALHAAHRLSSRFPDGQIFLPLNAHTAGQLPADTAEAVGTLLLATGISPQQIPADPEARSALWRSRLAGKKVLLVLDDATGSDQVRPLLPGASGCLVLVTSRRRLTALEGTTPISLDTLPPGQAADLFVRLAGRPGLQGRDSAVVDVVRLCGYLPLAIRLVAAGIRHHLAWTVSDLAGELASTRGRLAAMHAENVSVAAAFDLSYQELAIPQQRLFRRLSLHPGADIDAYAAAALDDIALPDARHGLAELYEHNLLFEPARGRYRFHDLLHEHARALAAEDDITDQQAAIGRILDYYLHAAAAASRYIAWRPFIAGPLPSSHPPAVLPKLDTEGKATSWLNTERTNLHACVEYAGSHAQHQYTVWIPVAMSHFLHARGYWDEAVSLGRAALEAARSSGDRHGEICALYQLGTVFELIKDYSDAAASLVEALNLTRELGEPLSEVCVLNQLGTVQWLTEDYPAAAASLGQALRLSRHLGDRHGQACALHQLGVVQRRTRHYPAALTSLNQSLQLFRDLGDRREQALTLADIGIVQQRAEDYPAAAASLGQAIQLSRDLGERHGQAWALDHLGVVQEHTGAHQAAIHSLTEALRLSRDLGDRHGQARRLINLGKLMSQSSAYSDAHDYFTHALTIAREIKAPVLEALALEAIGHSTLLEGNLNQGTEYLRQALTIYYRIGAPEAKRVEEALARQP
jgi:tetratricopeptide (TPR) repeat protein